MAKKGRRLHRQHMPMEDVHHLSADAAPTTPVMENELLCERDIATVPKSEVGTVVPPMETGALDLSVGSQQNVKESRAAKNHQRRPETSKTAPVVPLSRSSESDASSVSIQEVQNSLNPQPMRNGLIPAARPGTATISSQLSNNTDVSMAFERTQAVAVPGEHESGNFCFTPEIVSPQANGSKQKVWAMEKSSWAQSVTAERHEGFMPRGVKAGNQWKGAGEPVGRSGQGHGLADGAHRQVTSRHKLSSNGQSPVIGRAGQALIEAASVQIHRQLDGQEDENVGVQSMNDLTRAGESVFRTGEKALTSHHTKHRVPVDLSKNSTTTRKGGFGSSNPVSRRRQRQNMRKHFTASWRGRKAAATAQTAGKSAEAAKKTGSFAVRHRHGLAIVALMFLLFYLVNSLSACTPLVQTILNGVAIGTYPAEEADILAAENVYRNMEQALQDELDNYCLYHPEYNEAVIEQQELWHDPHVLMALISATIGDSWTVDAAIPIMERLFDRQYEVTVRVETETRYTTEYDAYGNEVQVPYTYSICYVTLVNNNLSHLPLLVLNHERVSLYALYMSTLGNMPDIFAGNPYASVLRDPVLYDVPEELLAADESFARLIMEAEKYIGYPYVWGGSSPETSFDCSGFISYVFTASGVYNIGHRSATGLYEMCQEISADRIRPGDLVFFAGTMGADVDGVTHVGLYVGNDMMIHCGSPISYADLSDAYWQQHFYSYGRVPY